MRRPRLVWSEPPAKAVEQEPPRPRRELRPRVRLTLAGGILALQYAAIYAVLDAIGGPILAVPVLVALGTLKQSAGPLIRAANRLARRILPDHSPGNGEGVSS